VDLPGHGAASSIVASLDETADLLDSSLPEGPIALGGYSMGARVALHVALRHRERVSALVVLGATRGIEDTTLRQDRVRRDRALAERIEDIGVEAFLDEWLAQPMFCSLPQDPRERVARSHDATGLANSLRHCGAGTQEFLGPHLGALRVPTLCLAGDRDIKFSTEARAIASSIPGALIRTIPNAQHAAHLEQPDWCAHLISSFLKG
jgi:2-succinyl-6-hydroxy-2,4-cyclohexadiene-1-carboxylate synthase